MTTAKLNQIIAVEKSIKNRVNKEVTDVYHLFQKSEPLRGISRTYRPKDEDGETFPPEATRVQVNAEEALKGATTALVELFDVIATKDWGNTGATADIVVDGQVLLAKVPVTYLLFLEKQLVDLHTLVSKLPLLDSSEAWKYDDVQGAYAAEPAVTTKTKKIPRNHVKAPATDKHPAQVEVYHEDVVVGNWTTVKYSGALPSTRVAQFRTRIERLQQAVKFARESANGTDVRQQKVGATILNYVFAS